MNRIIRRRSATRKRRLTRRLDKFNYPDDLTRPMLRATNIEYELAGRAVGTACGGIGLVHQLVRRLGLARSHRPAPALFKIHLPYHESDHVLNLAYNALCGGTCLEDLELRRQDEAYLNALGAARIPDPTTAGDFCRRFTREDLQDLHEAFDVARRKVWAGQPPEFFACAWIEVDGTLVETAGECKQGIDLSYKGMWGYHPLVLSLANTGEVLRLVNRPGNRPSHEGRGRVVRPEHRAVPRGRLWQNRAARRHRFFTNRAPGSLARARGRDVHLRHGLHARVARPGRRSAKIGLETAETAAEIRGEDQAPQAARAVQAASRRTARVQGHSPGRRMGGRNAIPAACLQTRYRLIIVRKNLTVSEPRQGRLFDDYRYFFYITNEGRADDARPDRVLGQRPLQSREPSGAVEQGAGVVRAGGQAAEQRGLHADDLAGLEPQGLVGAAAARAGWAMARAKPGTEAAIAEAGVPHVRQQLVRIPCQVVRTGGKLVLRLLAYNEWQRAFFQLAEQLGPLRC